MQSRIWTYARSCGTTVWKWSQNPRLVFDSENFPTLDKGVLLPLLKRDDLQMEEIEIWKSVIKWGIAQHPGLFPAPDSWSDRDFVAIKRTLEECIQLIRYFDISSSDFCDEVRRSSRRSWPGTFTGSI